ncbi:MAG: CDP-alcohol phosphatidyltransferase family protein [Candidatus Gastranaerophilales bacterium]|nr:CDP-alcohol phosphatidyltransferase family protein [Candidatus Gastranaerophilales bacterium]
MANLLTILRMILCVIAIEFLFTRRPDLVFASMFITLFVIVLDGLDGYVARSLKETSKFGSVFDILGDRVVENLYWIAFASLGWVGVWVPMVVVTRGILTDGFRSIALSQGYTAFGSSTMMKNKFCHFLTASRFSRAVYGVAKTLVFLMLIIAYIPNIEYLNIMTIDNYTWFVAIQPNLALTADILVYITVAMCIIRAIPVFVESKRYINNDKEQV